MPEAGTTAGTAAEYETKSEPRNGSKSGSRSEKKRGGGRDRYFDLLRGIALFRVVFYHLMGWAWLPIVFPSMGVMFALAGNLMARSLARRPALEVVRGRLRRLLPPLWLLGAVGVTGMTVAGWSPDDEGHPGWWWLHLGYWILPLSDPPYGDGLPGVQGLIGDDWAVDMAVPLWYIRAYLWFVLLSPLLLRALRRLPWPTILAPVALSAALEFGALSVPSWRLEANLSDFGAFGACWLLGMAHQEGILPGGGVALLRASNGLTSPESLTDDERVGYRIIVQACRAPLKQIVENAGEDGNVIAKDVLADKSNVNFGYNARTGKMVDMVKEGIIDPTKVVRSALQNAASVATLLLTSDAMIAEEQKDDHGKKGAAGGGYDDMY
jgi:hypothetical protein